MKERLIFKAGEQRKFLLEVEKKSGLKVGALAKMVGVVGRSYRDWKREKLNMSLSATHDLCESFGIKLSEEVDVMIRRWKINKSSKARIGGLVCYRKHGSFATLEGRRKGGAKALAVLRKRGIIPYAKEYNFQKIKSEELAEFVGIMLGDGGITMSQACITLNSEADREYLGFVIGIISRLFNFVPHYIKRKDSKANCIYCNGINYVRCLTELGLKIGNKVKLQVDVPEWIEDKVDFKIACVRGLMDTDGGVFIHKYKVNEKEYKYLKISFSNRSEPLLHFVERVLRGLKLNPKIVLGRENKQVWLYNHREVEKYLQVVGTHNPRLLRNLGGVR